MIGIVVVSHSRTLALAAVALAQEMVPGRGVRIEVAAGLDDTTFGTDATQIRHAITAADQGEGVLVLMDLGSAVLSAEVALEFLDDETRERVLLCPAPLVEGLIVATVAAAGGAGREEMAAEAAGALAGKTAHSRPCQCRASPNQPRTKPAQANSSASSLWPTRTVCTHVPPPGWCRRSACATRVCACATG